VSERCEAFWSKAHESMLANNMPGSTVHRAQHADKHFHSLAVTLAATRPWLCNAVVSYNSVKSNRMRFNLVKACAFSIEPELNRIFLFLP